MNETPSQTIGPFFRFGLDWMDASGLAPPGSAGAVEVRGVVYDGAGAPVPDAMLELWQPPRFGRVMTEPDGSYRVHVAGDAAHIDVSVFARGLLQRVVTRMYLPGPAAADPVLAAVPEERRATLLAAEEADGCLRFDVHLQGPRETVFFAY